MMEPGESVTPVTFEMVIVSERATTAARACVAQGGRSQGAWSHGPTITWGGSFPSTAEASG